MRVVVVVESKVKVIIYIFVFITLLFFCQYTNANKYKQNINKNIIINKNINK